MRGPVVYCAEAVDNGGAVHDLFLPVDGAFETESNAEFGLVTIAVKGERLDTDDKVYSHSIPVFEKSDIKLIPYNCFANRGASDMRVWMNCKF